MEWYVTALLIVVLLVGLIGVGIPIPFALGLACLPFLLAIQNLHTSLVSAELMIWSVWVNYLFVAIPLFVFLGELIGQSAIGQRLYRVMHQGIPVRGSAAFGSIGACAGFGAVSGSSLIGALTIGSVALPQMLKLGYSPRLASGAIAAGGTLSVLLPPSLILIFYGLVTDVSVGRLFLAGIVPGIILSLLFASVILIWRIVRPDDLPTFDWQHFPSIGAFIVALVPIAVIGFVIVASIYFGVATPTEAAAVAVILTLGIGFTFGGLTPHGAAAAAIKTISTVGYLSVLLAAAMLFGFVLNYYRIPQQFTNLFVALDLSPVLVLTVVIFFFFILGMFLEPASMTFIALPAIYPLIAAAGYDLIWFGIVFTITMEVAVLTPPVGLNLYVLQSLAPREVKLLDVIYGSIPFIIALFTLLIILILFPEIATTLPNRLR